MPIVRIDIQGDKSTAYKRDILRGVRSALVSALGADNDRVMQRLIETPVDNIDIAEGRSDSLTIIEISMLPGRGSDLKSKLYTAIVENLGERPGIHQRDIMVLVNDPSAECFAIGGVMQCTMAPSAEDESVDVAEDEAVDLVPDAQTAVYEPADEALADDEPAVAEDAASDAEPED